MSRSARCRGDATAKLLDLDVTPEWRNLFRIRGDVLADLALELRLAGPRAVLVELTHHALTRAGIRRNSASVPRFRSTWTNMRRLGDSRCGFVSFCAARMLSSHGNDRNARRTASRWPALPVIKALKGVPLQGICAWIRNPMSLVAQANAFAGKKRPTPSRARVTRPSDLEGAVRGHASALSATILARAGAAPSPRIRVSVNTAVNCSSLRRSRATPPNAALTRSSVRHCEGGSTAPAYVRNSYPNSYPSPARPLSGA